LEVSPVRPSKSAAGFLCEYFVAVLQAAPTGVPLAASADAHGVPQATSMKFVSLSMSDETCNRVCLATTCLSAMFTSMLLMFGWDIAKLA
jgi:hypothetical protein